MRLRVTCKWPDQPGGGFTLLPSGKDCFLTLIADDGTETPLVNVSAFAISVDGNGGPVLATVTFLGAEIDVECFAPDVP